MTTLVKTHLYREDLHGNNPDNFITNEVHTLQVPGVDDYHFIIPRAAPFFAASVKVLNFHTNEEYRVNIDYTIGHHFIEAMESIGRPIAGSIRFMRRDISGIIRLEYRTLGGEWGYNDTVILQELARKQYNPVVRVWGNIAPMPFSFPPLIHDQSLDTLVGSAELDQSLARIGDILASTTAGVDESHLANIDNPHRTTKTHVGLSNVDNFKTSTIQETVDGESNVLFTTPRGVFEAIQQQAILPLKQFILDNNGDISFTKADVGLGNVENFPPATAAQAIDTSNNATYLTPFTANLLLQSNTTDPRLEQLLTDFGQHLNVNNPHGIKASDIGAMTALEVIALIEENSQTDTFDGKTGTEWRNLFPHDADFLSLVDQIKVITDSSKDLIDNIPIEPLTTTSGEEVKLHVNYNSYGITNANDITRMVHANGVLGMGGVVKACVAVADSVYYYDSAMNTIMTMGVTVPHVPPTTEPSDIWSSVDSVFYKDKADNELYYFDSAGTRNQIFAPGNQNRIHQMSIRPNVGYDTSLIIGVMTYYNAANEIKLQPIGSDVWITKFNSLTGTLFSTLGIDVNASSPSVIVTDRHLVIAVSGAVNTLKVYSLNLSAEDVNLVDVTSTFKITMLNGNSSTIETFLSGNASLTINGTHDTVVVRSLNGYYLLDLNVPDGSTFTLPTRPDLMYVEIKAGNDFIITLDNKQNVDFWGDDPENKLYNNSVRSF